MYITVLFGGCSGRNETDTDTNTDTDRKRHASWVMGHASWVMGTTFRLGMAFRLHYIYQDIGSLCKMVKP